MNNGEPGGFAEKRKKFLASKNSAVTWWLPVTKNWEKKS
jgi:hypothetical protein